MVKTVFRTTHLKMKRYSGFIPLYLFLSMLSLLSACDSRPDVVRLSGSIMGTYYQISFVQDDIDIDSEQVHQGTLNAMELVNQKMSTYIDNSELSLLNKTKSTEWQTASQELLTVIGKSIEITSLTDGAFDITVSPLVNAWGFGPEKTKSDRLDQQTIDHFAAFIGVDKFVIDSTNGIKKQHVNVSFDLSAIAKGYAVDKVVEYLLEQGIENFLVDIGGELRAKGQNEYDKAWQIAIEKPEVTGGIQQIIALNNKAIATSGNYRNYIEIDGRKYSHTFDPRLLKPVTHNLASASVIADNAMSADALATALMVMGEKQAYDFAMTNKLAVYLIIREAGQYKIRFTEQFEPYLQL